MCAKKNKYFKLLCRKLLCRYCEACKAGRGNLKINNYQPTTFYVIPAKAGIQYFPSQFIDGGLFSSASQRDFFLKRREINRLSLKSLVYILTMAYLSNDNQPLFLLYLVDNPIHSRSEAI